MKRITKHLSYANIMATVAVVFAMTGGAIAATGGFTAASSSIKACAVSNGILKLQTGKKCKKGQKAVSWNQQGVPGAKGETGPSGIAGLNGAAVPNATNAVAATTANNALALAGIPASGFTQRSCASDTGQVKGFAQSPAALPAGFIPIASAYNCSGEPVEARRIDEGIYEFRFVGNPAATALATAFSGPGEAYATITPVKPGTWQVVTIEGVTERNHALSLVLF